MLNIDRIVSSWNAGARRFKGYAEAEIVGQHFSRFYTPEDRATSLPERALATAREEGKFEGEGWRVRRTADASGRASLLIQSEAPRATA
jgi:PAS domain S-box-containing protein